MSAPKFRLMVDSAYGKWWAITEGHVTEDAVLREIADEAFGVYEGERVVSEVWHLHFMPRLKWCGNYGSPCDMDGEWHSHWVEVKPGKDTAHTVVRTERAS